MALANYGILVGKCGETSESAFYLGWLLKLDPSDAMTALEMFSDAGLVHQSFGSTVPGQRM